ncbi:DUF3560 domain-containing protein [Streptomyces chryseus]|uniref:DUF3560 domain-containing protein n=1 Tax=Streptomyces chryseus TaxID=68186 RepID=UPI00110FDCD4|nr:DUF3560 domain-containing protein [Streptomyces chryseus]GGW99958.1 hypothetical protein GCM10010353_14560 [Streptomyces chryseus]
MATIQITHTPAEGTLVDGDTERGDGTGDILKRYGFRWFRSLRKYGHPQSRDRAPRVVVMEAAAEELRAAGHTVTVEIAGEVRDNTTVRAAQHERLEDRRAALEAKGEKLTNEAEALRRRSDAMVEHLPLGQPVLPGRRGRAHRNLLDRSINTAIRSAKTAEAAQQMPARIEGSRRAEAYKERPDVTARRVDRLETELRALDRRMAGLKLYASADSDRLRRQYEGERAVLVERIAGDRAVLDAAREAGTFGRYSKDNVHRDDRVKIRGQWRTVVRANGKTVSVTTGYSWTDRYGWEEVKALACDHVQDTPDTPES